MQRSFFALPLLAAAVLAGCGGGGMSEQEKEGAGGEAQKELQERDAAARQVPTGDRVAYYQLATTSGLLRAELQTAGRAGAAATVSPGELDAAVKRLEGVNPRDAGLREVKGKLEPLAAEAVAGVGRARARILLARLDRLNVKLSQFLRRRPAQAALVPD